MHTLTEHRHYMQSLCSQISLLFCVARYTPVENYMYTCMNIVIIKLVCAHFVSSQHLKLPLPLKSS